jgi:hypothetical protein
MLAFIQPRMSTVNSKEGMVTLTPKIAKTPWSVPACSPILLNLRHLSRVFVGLFAGGVLEP